jgi:hypothetical protein
VNTTLQLTRRRALNQWATYNKLITDSARAEATLRGQSVPWSPFISALSRRPTVVRKKSEVGRSSTGKTGSYRDTPLSSPDTPTFSPDTPRHVLSCIYTRKIDCCRSENPSRIVHSHTIIDHRRKVMPARTFTKRLSVRVLRLLPRIMERIAPVGGKQ